MEHNPLQEKFSGNTFRAYLSGLKAMGLQTEVRDMMPARVQRLMDAPPLPTAWIEGDELPLIFSAVMKLHGLDGVRKLGYAATSSPAGRFLKPLMRVTLNRHGSDPGSLFGELGHRVLELLGGRAAHPLR